jgi:hypothetical protein
VLGSGRLQGWWAAGSGTHLSIIKNIINLTAVAHATVISSGIQLPFPKIGAIDSAKWLYIISLSAKMKVYIPFSFPPITI